MLIRHSDAVEPRAMEIDGAKGVSLRMLVGSADGAPTFAMRHFTVAGGGHTTRHSHNYEHEVFILQGSGRLVLDEKGQALEPGAAVYIPPNATHQFINTGAVPLKFLCLVPTSFDCGTPTPGS